MAVVAGRAEEAGRSPAHREIYGVAFARAVAPAPVVAEYLAPFLASGAWAVISEPPGAPQRWDEAGLGELGLEIVSHQSQPIAAVVLRRTGALPDRFPRRTGVARKRPLW